ncbi:MAG: type I-E CRISPR-associated protein Cse1/CasA [Candidatus Thiodiazotropha sp. (ex Lucinoma kastoroae)]|nr:type I-E CRISPR-associated protein Cse1/CasA [Candidatus Thiodiazotropha sp. (ex Lucinoma kastoroae)]
MNLLTSAWIPIREASQLRYITLEELLCKDSDLHLSLYRDDMETAALQLLISLVQAVFIPQSEDELRQRVEIPLTAQEFAAGISLFKAWFELDHAETPFMQSRGVRAKQATPIQKLFAGLPEGNNHAFFNTPGEVGKVCPSCAAIALFNQASNCPSFGGGFKANLRGSAPVNTFVMGESLRQTLWLNVLTSGYADRILPDSAAENRPTWIKLISAGEKIRVSNIGLARGLFWQPARVELIREQADGVCDSCQASSSTFYIGLNKEKFVYSLDDIWPHPHSPQIWNQKKDGSKEKLRFISFTTTAPAWTQLNQYLVTHSDSIPAHVVTQFKEVFPRKATRLSLYVSGYRNKQAAILMRRHELFSIPQDWEANSELVSAISIALRVRDELCRKLYGFSKQVGASVHESAQQQFDRRSEPMIHALLRDMGFKERLQAFKAFKTSIVGLARELFEQATAPYRHSIAGTEQYVRFKRNFNIEVAKLQ